MYLEPVTGPNPKPLTVPVLAYDNSTGLYRLIEGQPHWQLVTAGNALVLFEPDFTLCLNFGGLDPGQGAASFTCAGPGDVAVTCKFATGGNPTAMANGTTKKLMLKALVQPGFWQVKV